MKNKIKSVFAISLLLFSVILSDIYASTNTEVRTEDDLKISDSIVVTPSVKAAALKTPKVNEEEKIYDFAELLTDEEEKLIYSDIQSFITEHNLDMAVVTINKNNKYSAMEYADDFYDYNYFGKGSTFDGLLMLIDMDNREVWISTTGQAILIYDDYRIDNMLDYIAPNLTSRDYKEAVDEFIYYADRYATSGISSSNKLYYIDEHGDMKKKNSAKFYEGIQSAIMFSTIVTAVFVIIGVTGHRNVKKARKAGIYLDKESVNIIDKRDNFLRSNTTKVRIESSSSGGGSSSHRSSSGRSHGGGGRSF